jgi:hypothetical protein
MIKKYSYISLSFALICTGIYWLLGLVLQWQLEMNVAIKTLTPANYTVTYASTHVAESHTVTLAASQFFTQHHFQFAHQGNDQKLLLYFNDSTSQCCIKNIHLQLRAGFLKKDLGDWNGKMLQKLLDDPSRVKAVTPEFIVLDCSAKRPFLFNQNIYAAASNIILQNSATLQFWRILAAIVLAAFFMLMLVNIFTQKRQTLILQNAGRLTLTTYAFMVIIFVIMINAVTYWMPDMKSSENRAMAKLDTFSRNNFFQYPGMLSDYTNDHFAFRNSLFFMHSVFKAKLFHTSSLPDRVIFGKEGWMFEADDQAQNDFRGINRFEETDLQKMASILKERVQWLEARGIRYYIFVPPNRNRIYSEFFPERYAHVPNYGHNRLDYFKKYLFESAGIQLLDPTDSMMKYKQLYDVYYSTDTHWNIFGAWVGYQFLMNEIRKDFPVLQPVNFDQLMIRDSFNNRGDLSAMLALQEVYKRKEYALTLKDSSMQLNFPPSASILMHYDNQRTIGDSKLKLMLFRDSYSNYLIPFLNLHFSQADYIWSYDFLHEMIAVRKPDIVILEVQQRAMIYALMNENLFAK